MLRFGLVCNIYPSEGLVRVKFPEDGITSAKLPVLVARSKSDKDFDTFDINEQVACLMDEKSENGVVLGAIYSAKENPPTAANKDVVGREFADGAKFNYDRQARKLTIEIGNSKIEMDPSVVKFNSGLNFGMVNVLPLTTRLNIIEVAFNALVVAYNAFVVQYNTHLPPPLPANIAVPFTVVLTPTVQAQIEDTKVKH
jgi:phage baseplate assembly protein V